MSWERMFSSRVLERGYDYWCDDLVRITSRTNNVVTALVSGSEDYEVEIILGDDGLIARLFCDCPHASDGNNCKHMAAVIYELEEERDVGRHIDEQGRTKISLQAVIESLSTEQLRMELLRALSSDDVQAAQLIARYSPKQSDDTGGDASSSWDDYVKTMQLRIRQVINNCSDRGFVDWRQGSRLVRALDNEVFRDLMDTVEYGEEVEVTFGLSLYLLNALSDITIDGSDGEHNDIGESLVSLWEEIHKLADDEQRDAMFHTMLTFYETATEDQWFFSDLIWTFMQEHFDTETLNRRKLALVDIQLKDYEAQIEGRLQEAATARPENRIHGLTKFASYSDDYSLAKLVCERIVLMEKIGFDHDDIVTFRKGFRFLHQIRELEMKELEEKESFEELIELLKESKDLDAGYSGLVARYSDKLIECYERLGQDDKARNEAYDFVACYQPGSLDGFIRLKAFYPTQEWEKTREDLFDSLLSGKHDLKRLYREEGLYDRIMKAFEKETSEGIGYAPVLLNEIFSYEDVLRPTYEHELLEIYRQAVIAMVRPTTGRACYQEISKRLRHMLDYADGESCVNALLSEWRITYKNRPALQDELKGVFAKRWL